jgi:hypothetical protein
MEHCTEKCYKTQFSKPCPDMHNVNFNHIHQQQKSTLSRVTTMLGNIITIDMVPESPGKYLSWSSHSEECRPTVS